MNHKLAGFLAVILCLAFGSASAWGQAPAEPTAQDPEAASKQYEYNVKAAFLYSFGRYVEWPEKSFAEKDSPFVIGIFGENPFGEVLDRIAKAKTIVGRRIVVRKVESPDKLGDCHILFVPTSVKPEVQLKILEKAKGKPLLLVGETPRFAELGGDVNFFLEGDRVRFEINVDALHQDKMQIDAKLLSLGKKIASAKDSKDKVK